MSAPGEGSVVFLLVVSALGEGKEVFEVDVKIPGESVYY